MGKMHRSIGDGWNMVSEISADDGPSIGRRKNDRRPMSLLVRFMRLHPKDDVIPRMLYIHSHHAYIATDNATVAQGKRRQQIPPLRNLLTLLSSFSYIYIFIRINCSFKNKKLKKQRTKRHTTCQMHTNYAQRKRYWKWMTR